MFRTCAFTLALLAAAAAPAAAQTYGETAAQGRASAAEGYSLAALQRALQRAGYDPGPADGAMGERTRIAIAAYQRDNGLAVTGQPSPRLFARMAGAQPLPSTPRTADRVEAGTDGELVADVQLALRQRGYGVSAVTGALDAETRAAVRAYQRDAGLAVTGRVDRALLAELEGGGRRDDAAPSQAGAGRGGNRAAVAFEVEQRLQDKGFAVGPVDGEIDQRTVTAIRQYQEMRGFQPTGEVSRQLLSDLRASNVTVGQGGSLSPEGLAEGVLRGLGRQFQGTGE